MLFKGTEKRFDLVSEGDLESNIIWHNMYNLTKQNEIYIFLPLFESVLF